MTRTAPLPLRLAPALLLASCVSTTPVVWKLDRVDTERARRELPQPMLETLREFGNNLAALMLTDYRFHGMQAAGEGAFLYRYDTKNPKLPRHAYLVFRLEGRPSISTNVGEKNNLRLDDGSFCLVPADEPAKVSGGGFQLQFTRSGFMEAFNPWCIGERGSYPTSLLLWFKNPQTKDGDMKRVAALLLGAFPRLRYGDGR